MKNLKVSEKLKRALAVGGCVLVMGSTLTGCVDQVVIDDAFEIYDVIDSNGENVSIDPQVLDVPGEKFKLVVEYSIDGNASKKWRVTDNKKLFTKVYTKGLDKNTKVYIDNVHVDTTIVSTYEAMNGILQDTMDDRIHNSLMLGFPISDGLSLYAVNEIEGQNETFISGSFHGFNGYNSGSVTEKRYTESDYLAKGVYANKIASVYGLLVQKGDSEPYGVDVSSDIVISVCNTLEFVDLKGNRKIRTYSRNGNYIEEEINADLDKNDSKVKVKK